jgi:hypothetical protein
MSTELPHYKVLTRLGVSKIHGVGVFAIQDISKDTPVFYGDNAELVWVDAKAIDGQPAELKKLYEDFAILKDGKYGCPSNWNNMTVSWYLNEPNKPDKPNVRCDEDYQFYALRDIKKGEELTVNYDTYSESNS